MASLLSAGCAGASQNQAPHTVGALKRAVATASSHGFKMNLSMNEDVDGTGAVFSASGSFAAGLRAGTISLDMQVPAFGEGGSLPVVIAHGTIYERLPSQLASMIPGGRPWLSLKQTQVGELDQLPGLNGFIRDSFTFAGPTQYADFLGAASGPAKELGQSTVGGVQTTHYQSQVSITKLLAEAPTPDPQAAQQLARLLRSQGDAAYAPVNVWVDQSGDVRQIQTSVKRNYSGHSVSFAIVESITNYGAKPTPAVPLPENTTSLFSLVQNFPPSSG
jgi:hypothetical protein